MKVLIGGVIFIILLYRASCIGRIIWWFRSSPHLLLFAHLYSSETPQQHSAAIAPEDREEITLISMMLRREDYILCGITTVRNISKRLRFEINKYISTRKTSYYPSDPGCWLQVTSVLVKEKKVLYDDVVMCEDKIY